MRKSNEIAEATSERIKLQLYAALSRYNRHTVRGPASRLRCPFVMAACLYVEYRAIVPFLHMSILVEFDGCGDASLAPPRYLGGIARPTRFQRPPAPAL
jgi:hypothetical protein